MKDETGTNAPESGHGSSSYATATCCTTEALCTSSVFVSAMWLTGCAKKVSGQHIAAFLASVAIGQFQFRYSNLNFRSAFYRREGLREMWEIENAPEHEIEEFVDILAGYGVAENNAREITLLMSKCKHFFVQVHMAFELGLLHPLGSDSPLFAALASSLLFTAASAIPCLALRCPNAVSGIATASIITLLGGSCVRRSNFHLGQEWRDFATIILSAGAAIGFKYWGKT